MSSQPRILHVSTARTWRGGEQQIAYLYEALHHLGLQQVVLCRKDGALHHHATTRGWHVVPHTIIAGIDPVFAGAVRICSVRNGINIIHLHDGHAVTAGWLAASVFGCKTPQFISRRVMFPLSKGVFSRLKYTHRRVAGILCVSTAVANQVAADVRGKVPVHVVHDGIDTGKYRQQTAGALRGLFHLSQETLVIGHVAAMTAEKGWEVFLEAGSTLAGMFPNIHLIAIGDGPLRLQLEQQAAELGLTDRITFTGFLEDVPQYLPDLNLLLFPSATEGLGSVILDALAAGVPVVASRTGGIPDIITDGSNGLLADPGQVEQFVQQTQRLLSDEDLQQRLIAVGRQTADRFSYQRMADSTLRIYQQPIS